MFILKILMGEFSVSVDFERLRKKGIHARGRSIFRLIGCQRTKSRTSSVRLTNMNIIPDVSSLLYSKQRERWVELHEFLLFSFIVGVPRPGFQTPEPGSPGRIHTNS